MGIGMVFVSTILLILVLALALAQAMILLSVPSFSELISFLELVYSDQPVLAQLSEEQ